MAAQLITADTSVVVPGLVAWHEAHEESFAALEGIRGLPAHVLVESFAVLTRLPRGRAIAAADTAARLAQEFPEPCLTLSSDAHRDLLDLLRTGQVVGGAVYDAVVGLSAQRAGAVLRTRDAGARPTYLALGVDVEMID